MGDSVPRMMSLKDLAAGSIPGGATAIRRGTRMVAGRVDGTGDEIVVATSKPRLTGGGMLTLKFRRGDGRIDRIFIPDEEGGGASKEDVSLAIRQVREVVRNGRTERAMAEIARGYMANMRKAGFGERDIASVMAEFPDAVRKKVAP